MNGNDIGSWSSNLNTDIFNLLNNLICHFQNLKELHISDCKLNFSESDFGHSSIKFFNSIKSKFYFYFKCFHCKLDFKWKFTRKLPFRKNRLSLSFRFFPNFDIGFQ